MVTEWDPATARAAALTDAGKKRPGNEDAAAIADLANGSLLLAVADGVGGMGHGDMASAHALQMLETLLRDGANPDAPKALAAAFAQINRYIYDMGGDLEGRGTMASTLVAAVVQDGRAWLASVGDSRAYLLRDGSLAQLTEDHSWVAEQLAAGAITAEEAETSQYRHVITRAMGVEETVEPQMVGPVDVPAGAALLLCSDGLYRVVTEPQMAQELAKGAPQAICRQLVDLANAGGGPDNIAVAVLKQP